MNLRRSKDLQEFVKVRARSSSELVIPIRKLEVRSIVVRPPIVRIILGRRRSTGWKEVAILIAWPSLESNI